MPDIAETMCVSEYTTLREEMLQNKSYVFERPLLIIVAVGIASVELNGKETASLLPFLLAIILLINLWFTVNRLKSGARISSYIDLILEGKEFKWIGWERSLRNYRIWTKTHTPQEKEKIIKNNVNKLAIPDAMMFYPPIFWFHIAIVAIAIFVSGLLLITEPQNGQSDLWMISNLRRFAFLGTVLISCGFVYYCVGPYRPDKIRELIERERAVWKAVFLEIQQTDSKWDKYDRSRDKNEN
jgi:hypothetical protein